jgi:hypothetical protein
MSDDGADLGHGDAERELVIFAGDEPIARVQMLESKRYDRVLARSLQSFGESLGKVAPAESLDPDRCVFEVDHSE